MCGRYLLTTTPGRIAERFDALLTPTVADFEPRYNIAPSTAAPVVRMADGEHREMGRLAEDRRLLGRAPRRPAVVTEGAPQPAALGRSSSSHPPRISKFT